MKCLNKILSFIIALIWFVNGLYCKILNFVPRHQEIVSDILSKVFSREITFTIGGLEVLMTIWILINYKTKLNAVLQIIIVLSMNIIEIFYIPELLLWGKLNLIFALVFIAIIYLNEFEIKRKINAK